MSYSFGPGPLTPAIKLIIFINAGVYALTLFLERWIDTWFGLIPSAVMQHGQIWRIVSYLFVHSSDPMHVLFNMLLLWMFGVELERRWGTQAFWRYYFITGVGAGVCVTLIAALPFPATRLAYDIPTVGASGAVFGVMLAYALIYPNRPVLFMMMFPMPSRIFVLLMGALQFIYLLRGSPAVSAVAHLGGLVIGWLYLKGPRNMRLDLQYRMTKWRMERMRRRFNVHRGGRNDWEKHIH